MVKPFLDDYEPVEDRLARFWKDHPDGRILTSIVNGSHAGESIIMLAQVWKDRNVTGTADATGHAQETPGSNPVNKTSWVENCETSAIGRALANMGYAPKGQRPSREEMQKAIQPRKPKPAPKAKQWKPRQAQLELLAAAQEANVDDTLRHRITRMLTGKDSIKDMTDDECRRVTEQLAWFDVNRTLGLEALANWEAENGIAS